MPIRPIKFYANGNIDVWHDEFQHGGTTTLSAVRLAGISIEYLEIDCPVPGCDSVTSHPIGGGAAPDEVQELFVRFFLANSSHPQLAGITTRAQARAVARALANRMDGPNRWRINS